MNSVTLTRAFAQYRATLVNRQWACSAMAEDGSLVISCWEHLFSRETGGALRYEDRLSRWTKNERGSTLLSEHLAQAVENDLPVRLVIASPKHPQRIIEGEAGRDVPKTFSARKNLVGTLVEFDGDRFVIDFHRDDSLTNRST